MNHAAVLDRKLGIPVLKLTAIGQPRPTRPAGAERSLADLFDDPAVIGVDTNLDADEFIENFVSRGASLRPELSPASL